MSLYIFCINLISILGEGVCICEHALTPVLGPLIQKVCVYLYEYIQYAVVCVHTTRVVYIRYRNFADTVSSILYRRYFFSIAQGIANTFLHTYRMLYQRYFFWPKIRYLSDTFLLQIIFFTFG